MIDTDGGWVMCRLIDYGDDAMHANPAVNRSYFQHDSEALHAPRRGGRHTPWRHFFPCGLANTVR